jgi:Cu(I)/Ag(I) efflux system membrane fusion protein
MVEAREEFAPPGQPTFEGREIVLGPRAGDFYLVRHGLAAGELVVRQGNFKIDAEIQIQAKPSMMTPEGGGGGGGHDHGGDSKKQDGGEHAEHEMVLPVDFQEGIRELQTAYEGVTDAVETADVGKIAAAFDRFGKRLASVDASQLTGHPRMVWKEFSMLLENDVVEGRDAQRMSEADRVYLLLKNHMRRVREQLDVPDQRVPRQIQKVSVPPEFQAELARIWKQYLAVGSALASDDYNAAQQAVAGLESALTAIDNGSIKDSPAEHAWHKEHANLNKLIGGSKGAEDIAALREQFRPLSEEIGVLAKGFGFGEAGPVYELHCPMAFDNQGAIWYQPDDEVRNPYYGASMLSCADRVEELKVE